MSFRRKIYTIVEVGTDSIMGKIYDIGMIIVIIVSLIPLIVSQK